MRAPLIGCLLSIGLLVGNPAVAGELAMRPAPQCAQPDQVKHIHDHYTATPGMLPALATRTLKLPEEVIASAMPSAVGTSGEHFLQVWDSMQAWDAAVFIVMKGGNVFETRGKILAGEKSQRSNYFNLDEGAGMSGHLRPDLVSSIYAMELPGRQPGGETLGIVFYDASGENIFGVYATEAGEGAIVPPPLKAQFEKTRALISSLPRVCGG